MLEGNANYMGKSDSFVNISTFAHLVSRIIDALLIDIDIKSKGYKKSVFGAIFLLNNYHYILKNIKNSQLVDTIEPSVLSNLDKLLQKQMDVYRSRYVSLLFSRSILNDFLAGLLV
jgi:exocyst complex protein 7